MFFQYPNLKLGCLDQFWRWSAAIRTIGIAMKSSVKIARNQIFLC